MVAEKELGLLFYKGDSHDGSKALGQMRTKVMSEDEARRYIDAKLLTHDVEEASSSPSAPPAYFAPLSSFVPIESTTAESLKSEEFELRERNSDSGCNCFACQLKRQLAAAHTEEDDEEEQE